MKVEQYWEEKEKEIQEKIIHKCLTEYLSGYQNISGPIWGLFFFTKQALYFQTFPKKSWYSSLIWQKENEDWSGDYFHFHLPWKDIRKIIFPRKKSIIKKIFSSPGSIVRLEYLSQNERYILDILFNSDEDIDILKENSSSIVTDLE